MITIQVKNIDNKGVLPIHGDGKTESFAAGYDIVAADDPIVVGEVGKMIKMENGTEIPLYKSISYLEYHTAIAVSPLWTGGEYNHLDLHPRSSVRKYNLLLANSIGLIDNDYRGEILVSYKYIFQPEDFVIEFEELEKGYKPLSLLAGINWTKIYRKGDKIGQLVAEKTNPALYTFVSELSETARGEGGHGSTDQLGLTTPILHGERAYETLAETYQKTGGVQIKKRYIDDIKERERTVTHKPSSGTPIPPTGIHERKG